MGLNFRQYGETGKPLLILPGLFGNLGNWGRHSKELAKNHAVYGVDLRNHGDSMHCDEMNYLVMAEDIKELLAGLGIESCYMMGHSMGGKVAMQLALNAPGLVDKLIVVDIAPVDYPRQAKGHKHVIAGMQALNLDKLNSRAGAERKLADFIGDEATRKFVLANLVRKESGGYRWRLNLAAIAANYDRLREKPVADRPYEKPTLFIKGALSDYIQEQHRAGILELFPNAEVKTIIGAGHWLHADKPRAFRKIVLGFLQRECLQRECPQRDFLQRESLQQKSLQRESLQQE